MIGEGKTRGQSAILDIDATTNQNIASVIIDHGFVKSEYLFYWFKYRYEANRLAGSGTGPKALNGQKVRELDFVLAPLEEQIEIVSRVEALFAKADTIETAYQNLKQQIDRLPQAILAKAFKGELVEQLPTDGDAKELLKEIAALRASLAKEKKSKKKKKVNA
jgi:type I restriction enzyme S subunit